MQKYLEEMDTPFSLKLLFEEASRCLLCLGAPCSKFCPTEKYCEYGCLRSGIDTSIQINKIQRFLMDFMRIHRLKLLQKQNRNRNY